MAIEIVKMYGATCDGCRTQYEMYDGWIAMNDKSAVREDIENSDEWTITKDGKCYCADCHTLEWDETEENLLAFSKDTQNEGAQLLGQVD